VKSVEENIGLMRGLEPHILKTFRSEQVSKVRGEVDLLVFAENWFILHILRDTIRMEFR